MKIELRDPNTIMKLSRLGSFHQSKLSFLRSFLSEFKDWDYKRDLFNLDQNGYGEAVYSFKKKDRVYSLVCFANQIKNEERSDRVIATKWDAAFTLHDGIPSSDDIKRLKNEVPKQEIGRLSFKELTLSRANKSVRVFNHVVESLSEGKQPDLDLLSKSCNATIVHEVMSASKDNVGKFLSSSNKTLGGLEHWVVDAEGGGTTIIIRGSTVDVVGEVERCFDDSLGVVCQMYEDGRLLPGGGATYVALARLLRRYAETIPDREQLAIEAYGDALEVIVRVLAENGGMDPIESLLSVVSKQTNQNSDKYGLNLYTGNVENMVDSGVIEPLGIVRQAIIGATEAVSYTHLTLPTKA